MVNAVYSLAEARRTSEKSETERAGLISEKKIAQQNRNYKDNVDNIIALNRQLQQTTDPGELAILHRYRMRLTRAIERADRAEEEEMNTTTNQLTTGDGNWMHRDAGKENGADAFEDFSDNDDDST